MKLQEKFLSLGKQARGIPPANPVYFGKPVDSIIIHWIGPYPKQSVVIPWQWWEDGPDKKGVKASAHFIVKGEDVLQALPLNEVGWHSGDSRNFTSIGIEVIPMNEAGEFAPDTIKTLKELVQFIRKTYPKTELTRHFDGVQKKDCPKFYTPLAKDGNQGDERWIALRNYLDDVTDSFV